ncbi:MAG: hypothetical protein ACRCSB_00300 [Bacteroidales bacterium]
MKKFFCLVVSLYIACSGFVSCTKNTAPPLITFGDKITEASVVPGDAKDINVLVKADGKLKEVKYFRKKVGEEPVPFGSPVTKFASAKKYESVVTLRDISSDFVLVVEATDKKKRTTTAEFAITVEGSSSAAAFHRALLGFNKLNSVGSSFSVNKGSVLLLEQAKVEQSEVDFMFFYGVRNGITIAAPSDDVVTRVFNNQSYGVQTWATRNTTYFVKVDNINDIETAKSEDITAAVNDANSTKVNHLNSGDVVAFKTASGKIGLAKIVKAGSNSSSTLSVNVRVL